MYAFSRDPNSFSFLLSWIHIRRLFLAFISKVRVHHIVPFFSLLLSQKWNAHFDPLYSKESGKSLVASLLGRGNWHPWESLHSVSPTFTDTPHIFTFHCHEDWTRQHIVHVTLLWAQSVLLGGVSSPFSFKELFWGRKESRKCHQFHVKKITSD